MRAMVVLVAGAALLAACRPDAEDPDGFTPDELDRILQHSPLGAPPRDPTNAVADREDAARLGRRLFFEKRFSGDGTVSCAVCHDPAKSFADGQALSSRFPLERNVPSLWNAAWQRWYFWDGRADSQWSQALQPFENPREHATTRQKIVEIVRSDARLKGEYAAVFGPPSEDVNAVFANLGKAIAAYGRRLVSRRSPFDVFVEGIRTGDRSKREAISAQAKKGLKLFVGRANCRLCHGGPNFTDGEFHNLGIPPLRGAPEPSRLAAIEALKGDLFNGKGPYSDDRAAGAEKLDGLAVIPELWGQVKTPSLRNVAKTAPYMHQGQMKALKDVVSFYSTLDGMVQSGHPERAILAPLNLSREEREALVAFLESLTDESIDPSLLNVNEPAPQKH